MQSSAIVICELKGVVDSHPEILKMYPELDFKEHKKESLIQKFLPFGAKAGDFFNITLSKYSILSYIFKVVGENRYDLLSFSVLIRKRKNPEIYKPILKEIIDSLDKTNKLSEEILNNNLDTIYDCINNEKDIIIDDITVPLGSIFKEIKEKYNKKPKLKGAFF
ncbi:MAG: hypothetical protein ACTSR8_07340 [Promethearchaeota archaeon]